MTIRFGHRTHYALAALVATVFAMIASGGCSSGEANDSESTGESEQAFTVQAVSKFIIEAPSTASAATDPMLLKETYGDRTSWMPRSAAGYEAPGLLADETYRGSPAAVSWDHNQRVDVFWLGTSGTIRHTASGDGGASWGSDDMGAPTNAAGTWRPVGTPAVVSGAPGYLDIIIIAKLNSTYKLWQKRWTGVWSAWVEIGNAPGTMPTTGEMGVTAAAWDAGRIDFWVSHRPMTSCLADGKGATRRG